MRILEAIFMSPYSILPLLRLPLVHSCHFPGIRWFHIVYRPVWTQFGPEILHMYSERV